MLGAARTVRSRHRPRAGGLTSLFSLGYIAAPCRPVDRPKQKRRERPELVRLSLNYLYGHFDEAGEDFSPNPDKHSNNAVLGRVQLEF